MLVDLVGLTLLPRPQQQRDDENGYRTAKVQGCQPEVLIGSVLCPEVEFECFAKAMQGEGARVHFAAFDALDGAGADFATLRQLLLCQSFLLAQFSDFESELRLVHGLLLSGSM